MTGVTPDRRRGAASPVSGLRGSASAPDLVSAPVRRSSAEDSLEKTGIGNKGPRGPYITKRFVTGVQQQLSASDLQTIDLVKTLHLAAGHQLQRLLWGRGASAARQARRQLRHLTVLQVLLRMEVRPGGVRGGSLGHVYGLGLVGQALTGVKRRRQDHLPGLAFVAHAVAITERYVTLQELNKSGRLELLHFDAEPACWRSFSGIGGQRRLLKPDAYAITAAGDWEDRWFLEIDRSTESPSRIAKKAQVYIDYFQSGREQAENGVFPKTLWVAPNDRRKAQLIDVLSELPAEQWQLFAVSTDAGFRVAVSQGAGHSQTSTTNEASPYEVGL